MKNRLGLVGAVVLSLLPSLGYAGQHIVEEGENLTGICRQYGVSVDEVAKSNRITNPNLIRVGQKLEIPDVQAKPEEIRISQEGIDLVKKYEGFSDHVYRCPAGKPTIAYGHMVKKGEKFGKVSRLEGEKLLRRDLEDPAEKAVREDVEVPLDQGKYDALTSFVYNVGVGNFEDSTLLEELNKGKYDDAAKQFGRWVHAGGRKLKGLERRRNEERQMFERAKYKQYTSNRGRR